MRIMSFNPTSTSGPNGYQNYKMSGGDRGGGGGNSSGCGFWSLILILFLVLYILGKSS